MNAQAARPARNKLRKIRREVLSAWRKNEEGVIEGYGGWKVQELADRSFIASRGLERLETNSGRLKRFATLELAQAAVERVVISARYLKEL